MRIVVNGAVLNDAVEGLLADVRTVVMHVLDPNSPDRYEPEPGASDVFDTVMEAVQRLEDGRPDLSLSLVQHVADLVLWVSHDEPRTPELRRVREAAKRLRRPLEA